MSMFASMSTKTVSQLTGLGLIFSAVVTIWTLMFISKDKAMFQKDDKQKKMFDATVALNAIYIVLLAISAFQLMKMGQFM